MRTSLQRMPRQRSFSGASISDIFNLVGTSIGGIAVITQSAITAKTQKGINETNLLLGDIGLQTAKEGTKQTAMQLEAAKIAGQAAGNGPVGEAESSNTLLYVLLGVTVIGALGGGAYLLTHKKKA